MWRVLYRNASKSNEQSKQANNNGKKWLRELQNFYFCLIKFCSKSRATLSACSTNTQPSLPLHAKKRKIEPGILGHSLTNSFSAPRPQAAGIWQPRRVALFFIVGLLGFSAASLSPSQSVALCWAVCLPHPACQTAVPTRCHWWGPPNWHAWLKRLGAIITQITAGRGKHSLSVLVPMVEQ